MPTYIDTDAILTAIRDVIEDGAGNNRTISTARFDGGFYSTLARDEQSRRSLVTTRAEARIESVRLSEHSPQQPCNVYIYDLDVSVSVVRHMNNAHRLVDATRDDVKSLAVQDGDVLRQALCYPLNLTADNDGDNTGIISGRLRYISSTPGDVELEDGEAGRIVTEHRFNCEALVKSEPLQLLDLAAQTYTGGSSSSYLTGSPSRLRWQGAGTLRHEYRDDADGSQLFIEGARTNLLQYSEALGTSPWATNLASITANQATAPDGTTTADLLTNDGTSGQHYVYQSIGSTPIGGMFVSVFARQPDTNAGRYLTIRLASSNDNAGATFDLTDGSVVFEDPDGVQGNDDAGVFGTGFDELANDWRRYWVTFATQTVETRSIRFVVTDSVPSVFNPSETSSSSVLLWGAMAVGQSGLPVPHGGSYIRTEGATATRSHERIRVATSNIPSTMLTGAWEFDIWPQWSSDAVEIHTTYVSALYSWNSDAFGGLSDYIAYTAPADLPTRIQVNVGQSLRASVNVDHAANEKITIKVNPTAGTLDVNGTATTVTAWSFPSAALAFGDVYDRDVLGVNWSGPIRFSNPRRTL